VVSPALAVSGAGRIDLFAEDVGVAGVSGELDDHCQQCLAHGEDSFVGDFGGVVEAVAGCDFSGYVTGVLELGDDSRQCFGVGNGEGASVSPCVSVAGVGLESGPKSLKPDSFGGRSVFDQEIGVVSEGTK
jgi:hypothetical protein